MNEPTLISHPDLVTSEWLTAVLQTRGIDGQVTAFSSNSIGTGQVGENVRFELTGDGDIPRSVVGKFPSVDPVSRQTGIDLLNYKREVHFYQNLQHKVAIQTPKVFYAEIDDASHDFVIMMEDLAPGIQGDQLAGCMEDQARLAMEQLAHLHGPVWADSSIVDGDIVSGRTQESAEAMAQLYEGLSPGFLQRYETRLTADEKEMVQLVGKLMMQYGSNYTGDSTLIHIDYRLDNMMFGGPYPLTVVDWQSLASACALNDASYFMGTSVIEDSRRELDEPLLQHYFDTLSRYDVSLTWDDCWKYYRQHAPAGLIMAVIASMIVGETDRGNDMFMAMAKRSARMCRELDAVEALREN